MAEEMFTAASPKAVEGLVEAWSSFTPASRALDGLTPEQATTKLEGWPYSVADVVAHMLFWQRHDFATIETGAEPHVSTGADWPAVTEDDWPRLMTGKPHHPQTDSEPAPQDEALQILGVASHLTACLQAR